MVIDGSDEKDEDDICFLSSSISLNILRPTTTAIWTWRGICLNKLSLILNPIYKAV